MAGILIPEKAPELFAYLGIIIRAERNYPTGAWVAYDRQYRRKALARRDLNWSTIDSRGLHRPGQDTPEVRAVPKRRHPTARTTPPGPSAVGPTPRPGLLRQGLHNRHAPATLEGTSQILVKDPRVHTTSY